MLCVRRTASVRRRKSENVFHLLCVDRPEIRFLFCRDHWHWPIKEPVYIENLVIFLIAVIYFEKVDTPRVQ
jgi:hypothetical protein